MAASETRLLAVTAVLLVAAAATAIAIRQAPSHVPRPPATFSLPTLAPEDPAILLAAGDIADCDDDAAATAQLLGSQPGVVAALGDLAYPDGSPVAFAQCYHPAWGAVRDRTRPALGNHDVRTADAAGFFGYFGARGGPQPQGYYSYGLGDWHVIVLNSNCDTVGGCQPGDPQYDWLRDELADTSTGNVLAYWHHPRWSTGHHGDTPEVAAFWDLLVDADVDIVLNGHDHDYQRFMPVDAGGRPDPTGIRQFVVGTGGAHLRPFVDDRATIAYRQSDRHGVLRLELRACGYRWAFLPVGGGDPLDAGTARGTC